MLKLLLTLFSIFPLLAKSSITVDIINIHTLPELESLHQLLKIGFIEYAQENANSINIGEYVSESNEICNLIIKLFRAMSDEDKEEKRLRIENQKYIKKFTATDLKIYNKLILLMMYLDAIELKIEYIDKKMSSKIKNLIEYLDHLILQYVHEIDYPINSDFFRKKPTHLKILDSLRSLVHRSGLNPQDLEEVTLSEDVTLTEKPTLKLKSEPRNIQKVQAPQQKRERHSKKKARR